MSHDLDLWPFAPKINRAHPWLMGSKCMKFYYHIRWITESAMDRFWNHFQSPIPRNLDLWTPKSIGRILDSCGASVWSFMIIGGLQSQLWFGNHFQSPMPRGLDIWPFDPKINRSHPWFMGSNCMKFHDHRSITESVTIWKPFSITNVPWPWPLTFWPQNQ